MKSEAVVLNGFMPMAVGDVCEDLRKSHLVSIAVDASNRKQLRIVPFLVQYFVPEQGIKVN
jgi:wyosine [tRNA(Phe)-imidazoG37] synthetase (radical SAM superfamily)